MRPRPLGARPKASSYSPAQRPCRFLRTPLSPSLRPHTIRGDSHSGKLLYPAVTLNMQGKLLQRPHLSVFYIYLSPLINHSVDNPFRF